MHSKKFSTLEAFPNVYKIFLGIILTKYVGLVIGVHRSSFARPRGWGDLSIYGCRKNLKVDIFFLGC